MSQANVVPADRRQRRREETIEEVLGIAAEIMPEQGVAGLSVGEIARRMGIRALPGLVSMFARYCEPPAPSARGREHHADKD
jgi:hypothetical protein